MWLSYNDVFKLLNSKDFLRDVPRYLNSRGTYDNIRLVITVLVLLRYNYLTSNEVRLALDAFTLTCREYEDDYMELEFNTVQKALRLMGKVISQDIFNSWCEMMKKYLLCNQKDRLLFKLLMKRAEKEFEEKNNCELTLDEDYYG